MKDFMMRFTFAATLIFLVLIIFGKVGAKAHVHHSNGKSVDYRDMRNPITGIGCCNELDCLPLGEDPRDIGAVKPHVQKNEKGKDEQGWMIDGRWFFSNKELTPSPDNRSHICRPRQTDGVTPDYTKRPFCLSMEPGI